MTKQTISFDQWPIKRPFRTMVSSSLYTEKKMARIRQGLPLLLLAFVSLNAFAGLEMNEFLKSLETPKREWLVVTFASRHANHSRGYNEHNYGLGYEQEYTESVRFLGGFYRNSYRRESLYVGLNYSPYRVQREWFLGATVFIVTGYENRPVPVVFPSVMYETEKFGINIGPILPTVVGFQFKIPL